MRYQIQMTGILGDTWYSGQHFTSRDAARAAVRFLMTTGNRFDTGKRARIASARVLEVK